MQDKTRQSLGDALGIRPGTRGRTSNASSRTGQVSRHTLVALRIASDQCWSRSHLSRGGAALYGGGEDATHQWRIVSNGRHRPPPFLRRLFSMARQSGHPATTQGEQAMSNPTLSNHRGCGIRKVDPKGRRPKGPRCHFGGAVLASATGPS